MKSKRCESFPSDLLFIVRHSSIGKGFKYLGNPASPLRC